MKQRNITGHNIYRLRKERGMTQKTLAKEMRKRGIHATSLRIALMEHHLAKVYTTDLVTFIRIFRISIDALFDEDLP